MKNTKDVTFEDVTIQFRNFSGSETQYNKAGDRNFALILTDEQAAFLVDGGWNVKTLKPRDDEEVGSSYIQVAVSFKNKPPKICMVTSKNITELDEEAVGTLDNIDIETADVTLNPYDWEAQGKSGRKAYVKRLYIKVVEDYLGNKWNDWLNAQNPNSDEYPELYTIDGELEERD